MAKLRDLIEEDFPDVLDLWGQIEDLHIEHLPERFQKPEDNTGKQDYLATILESEEHKFIVAELEGNLVGFIHLKIKTPPQVAAFVERKYGQIDELVVDKDYRRQGIGEQLMEAGYGWLIDKGIKKIELNVYEFNQVGQEFYRQLGFKTVSRKMKLEIKEDK